MNLVLTMLIGGLWHGANWNFVIWGGYHGALLAIERMIWGREVRKGWVRAPLACITFLLACVGWVFFRAHTFAAARFVLGEMVSSSLGHSLLTPLQWQMAAFALIVALAEEYGGMLTRLADSPAWARTLVAVAALLAIELFSATEQTIPFVYFQF